MTSASASWPHTMMVFVMMLFMISMVVAAQPPEAAWDHAGLVNIYNYVGDSITVHCKDRFTDLKTQRIAHGADYTFKVQPSREETTLYTSSFVGASTCSKSFLSGEGAAIKTHPSAELRLPGSACTRPPRRASLSQLPAFQSVDRRVPLLGCFSGLGKLLQ